ncbi:MAG: hypothetical protein AUG45_07190 [Ktedonobacter sp. 13_1_20CM_3_54_15]|nr:MAG: hypothetical protein AUH05_09990 [Ktedonobacter sp. 13_2_20CM_53_11]OLB57756.1 MAG: hypothetical protein AUI01_03850 [Ktedonobacter sp. 13_2_20CM_2_56_8]OLE01658.1 MAG: hypothetical protein AUG82_10790 [Ktedonobacter sp. 13_1_20CM_4_53_11]OLE33461.1 MAG: hypothetical protein AUG45_07190 [Ktedonobacter sp. 13_1_20CM_3_54_15]
MLNWNLRLLRGPAPGMMFRCCLIFTLGIAVMLSFPGVSAHIAKAVADGPTMQVNAGFNARYRDGNWVPFQVTLSNSGADFSGSLSVNAPAPYGGFSNAAIASLYSEPINLANGAQKQITTYIPINLGGVGPQHIKVRLLDSDGNVVRSQISTITSLGSNDAFVGILSDQNTGFNPLYSIALPNQGGSMIVEMLNASTMPTTAAVLNNFDLIVLDNFTTSTLSNKQLIALQTWVNQGGALIEVGGPEWKRTLSALPTSMVPLTNMGTGTLPAGTQILPVAGPPSAGTGQHVVPATTNAAIPISTAILDPRTDKTAQRTVVLAAGGIPLIVQEHQGNGIICYLAFDPTLDPVVNWGGASTLWKGLIQRALGNKLLNTTNGFSASSALLTAGLGGVLENLLTNAFPSPWLLIVLVLGYLVILGPVRFLIIRWRKKRDWNWRIVLSSIVIFSLLTYGIAIQQKGAAILSNRVSIVQLNNGGSSAHITTYMGVFLLNQGDYHVYIPGNGLVQPAIDQNNQGPPTDSGTQATISSGQNGTEVSLQGVSFSTTRSLLVDKDSQVRGGIVSQLVLRDGTLSGRVTNTLNYGLSDVYVLMTNSFARIGHLAAGQSTEINLRINNASANPGMSLADDMANSNGLTTPYGINMNSTAPPNELQRHMAILTALSGENGLSNGCGGGTCRVVAYSNGNAIYYNGGSGLAVADGSDPLLMAGSSATLIGWADQPTEETNQVMINGFSPVGLQETLIESPLSVYLSSATNLPTNLITGQLIDVQGTNVQYEYGGAYTMSTGSTTFEYAVPPGAKQQVSSLRFSQPTNLTQINSQPNVTSTGPVVDASRLQVHLYNWETGAWDTIQVSGTTFSTSDTKAYISSDGRVLLQLSNQDSTAGTILFGKPTLDLQGNAS